MGLLDRPTVIGGDLLGDKKMLCPKKIQLGDGTMVPCGQCIACRINRQRIWACRIQLEALYHPGSVFVTLTYRDSEVPIDPVTGNLTLYPKHMTEWMRAIRHKYKHINAALRFFLVGEYGSETFRPHYHAILFGADVFDEELIASSWNKGFVSVSEINTKRALYVAQYTLKKMTKGDDRRLMGRWPEFARMSNRRGIGYPAVGWLADHMSRDMESLFKYGDVYNAIRIDGRVWPLGSYIRKGVRAAMGLSDNPRERAIQLGNYDRETGEIGAYKTGDIYELPLPEEYCPHDDIIEESTPWSRAYAKQKAERDIPEIEKILHKWKKRNRTRTHITSKI